MSRSITITDASKGKPYRLLEHIASDNPARIGVKRISGRIGWYNISEDLEWRYAVSGQSPSEPIKIRSGLYNFDGLVKQFTDQIDGLNIEVNNYNGKIDMSIPDTYQIWFPDRVRSMLGLDDENWIAAGGYDGDRAIEFSPRRVLLYLKQLSTTGNLQSDNATLTTSQLLGFVNLSNGAFGDYFVTNYEKPSFKKLQATDISELDFDFKIEWRDRTEKLDNHSQPLDLVLEIK